MIHQNRYRSGIAGSFSVTFAKAFVELIKAQLPPPVSLPLAYQYPDHRLQATIEKENEFFTAGLRLRTSLSSVP